MKKILLAVALQRYLDFTPHALTAREVAMALASFYGATVHALTVEVSLPRLLTGETTEEKLLRFIQPLKEARITVMPEILEGSPRKFIPQHAREVRADLIVIGSHSKRSAIDITLGGTAAAVVANAPCRVILAAPPAEELSRTKELIIPEVPWILPYG